MRIKHEWDIKEHDWLNDSIRPYETVELYEPPKAKTKTKEIEPEETEETTEEEELLFKE